jgi:hypothetical protein
MSEKGEDISTTVESMSNNNNDPSGHLIISRTAVTVAQGGTEFGTPTWFPAKLGSGSGFS